MPDDKPQKFSAVPIGGILGLIRAVSQGREITMSQRIMILLQTVSY
ncbi:MAG: hypothetical protein PHY28_07180 [Dehalococcoidales bacterium]|nr:hypothetical protein [Dehalococcoidales bacterium]